MCYYFLVYVVINDNSYLLKEFLISVNCKENIGRVGRNEVSRDLDTDLTQAFFCLISLKQRSDSQVVQNKLLSHLLTKISYYLTVTKTMLNLHLIKTI